MAGEQWEGQLADGEFHLRQYLGGSESSAVFLTECGGRKPRKAAIKLVPTDPESARFQIARWERAAKLSHPHLIPLLRMGRCQLNGIELLYVVMEYADDNLSQVLPHRSLAATEASELLEPALDALAYLHRKGFVHGRLKPANFLAVGDQLKLSSDGLCRVGEPCGGSGKPGPYDPPEIPAVGTSPAGDVWSLAVTLVEALTQRLPIWVDAEQEEPVLPERLPASFLDIARHCLCRDPDCRWTVADIARCARGKPAAGRRRRLARWRVAVPVAMLGLVLAAVLAGPKLLNRLPQARLATPVPREQPEAGTEPAAPGGGLVPGEVVHQVLPEVPQKARDTIQGQVRVGVRVGVDPSGRVADATLDSPGPSRYFAGLALGAARSWKFEPARVNGRAVSSEWTLRFEFERTTIKVVPLQASR